MNRFKPKAVRRSEAERQKAAEDFAREQALKAAERAEISSTKCKAVSMVRTQDTIVRTCHAITVRRKDTLRQHKVVLHLCVKKPFPERRKAMKGHMKPRNRLL